MSAVVAVGAAREALGSMAPLFTFPDENYLQHVDDALVRVAIVDARAGRGLAEFAIALRALDRATREMTFTSTFDLAPSCSPYLGVQLFGDDSRDRARLMVGLRTSYRTALDDLGGELPDHLAVVLSYATRFDDDEWSDLVRLVLVPALEKMDSLLAKTSNPFRHLIAATRHLTRTALEEGGSA